MDKVSEKTKEILRDAANKYSHFWPQGCDKAFAEAMVWMEYIGDYCVERVKEEANQAGGWLSEAHVINLVMKAHKEECRTGKKPLNLVDIDIDDLEINVAKLKRLLDSKEIGLSTWWGFVQNRIDKISKYRSNDV